MADSNAKKIRAPNFSNEEKHLLTHLINKFRNIIENKASSASTWEDKNVGWMKLAAEFNAQSGSTVRSAETLRTKYNQLKGQTRQKKGLLRREQFKTGGGPSQAPLLEPHEELMSSIIGISGEGEHSRYDCDIIHNNSSDDYVVDYLEDEPNEIRPPRPQSCPSFSPPASTTRVVGSGLRKDVDGKDNSPLQSQGASWKNRTKNITQDEEGKDDSPLQPQGASWKPKRRKSSAQDEAAVKFLKMTESREHEAIQRIELLRQDTESKIALRKVKEEKERAKTKLVLLQCQEIEQRLMNLNKIPVNPNLFH